MIGWHVYRPIVRCTVQAMTLPTSIPNITINQSPTAASPTETTTMTTAAVAFGGEDEEGLLLLGIVTAAAGTLLLSIINM